jgi:hypothetical protein
MLPQLIICNSNKMLIIYHFTGSFSEAVVKYINQHRFFEKTAGKI